MAESKQEKQRHLFIEKIKKWPDLPGVYTMYDEGEKILYIGKAKNLKNRIRSYFQKPEVLTPKTRALMKRVKKLDFTTTHTELEALLLECNLIKKHRPRYNIRLKDDKNFPYFVLDFTHAYPQFSVTRKVKNMPHRKYFGPFNASVFEISRFLLKTFQLRDCSDSKFKNRKRPCLNYEIKTCTAPCVGFVSEQEYGQQVREAVLFLKGRNRELLSNLKKQMKAYSSKQSYELARLCRDKIQALEKIAEKQIAVMAEKQKNIDVIGAYVTEEEIQWVVLFVRMGALSGRKSYLTPIGAGSYDEALTQFLHQFYQFSLAPDEIWLSSDFADRAVVESALASQAGKKIMLRVRRSESALRLLGMAQENAKLLYKESREKDLSTRAGQELASALGLLEPPLSIECMDVSNLRDESPYVSLVHFEDGVPLKSRYRLFKPRTVEGQNDFAMLHEAVCRRFKEENGKADPDLLVIDGGKGQLSAAAEALKKVQKNIPLCSLAKSKTQSAFTLKDVTKTEERVFIPGRKNPILLKEGSFGLRLLQQVRDEAHRFGLTHHRKSRDKKTLMGSKLTEVEGLGPKSREKVLKAFASWEMIEKATLSELLEAGLNKTQSQKLIEALAELAKES